MGSVMMIMSVTTAYTQNSYESKSSGYNHHHHVGDYDYVQDIDEEVYDLDDTVDDDDDPGVTLVC